jgi:hypothetical protein
MNNKLFKVIKFNQSGHNSVIAKNLTLEKAQKYCNDPETSSRTNSKLNNKRSQKRLDEQQKHWFYGYTEQ